MLISTQIFPAARPARIPSGPEATASSTPSSGSGGEDDVGGLGDLARGVAPLQAVVNELLGVLAVSLLAVDLVSGGEKTGCHVAAHVTEADEADRDGPVVVGVRHFPAPLNA